MLRKKERGKKSYRTGCPRRASRRPPAVAAVVQNVELHRTEQSISLQTEIIFFFKQVEAFR
ncbi:unnamed protein product [Camellia sinensis]